MRADMVGAIEEIIGAVGDDLLEGEEGFVGDDLDDLLEGAGDHDDLMGAWFGIGAGNKRKRQREAIAALIKKRIGAGSIVRDSSPTKSREYVIGFDTTSVAAGATASPSKRPQVLFRPERIVIPSNIALDFVVVDVKVGKNSQFVQSGEVPAVVFTEGSFGVRLKMDTVQVSMDLTLTVRNTSGNTRNFTAAVIGPAVE